MTQQDIEIILEILLILIGLYLAFFKSYFQEKGKNLATLEDIEEITSKVEAIKTDFIRETEKLKLEIQFTNQIKFSLKSEELKSLLDFYEKYYLWLNILLDFYFSSYNEDNRESLKDAKNIINDSYFKFLLAEAKAELLIDCKPLFQHTKDMKLKTLEFQNYVLLTIGEFNMLLLKIEQMKASTPVAQQFAPYSEFMERKLQFVKTYNENKLKHYSLIAKMNGQFQRLCYDLLTSMSKHQAD